MENISSSPTLTNCIFYGNSAGYERRGMDNYDNSSPVLTNCTFVGNWATTAAGCPTSPTPRRALTNCILWANTLDEISTETRPAHRSSPIATSRVAGRHPRRLWHGQYRRGSAVCGPETAISISARTLRASMRGTTTRRTCPTMISRAMPASWMATAMARPPSIWESMRRFGTPPTCRWCSRGIRQGHL